MYNLYIDVDLIFIFQNVGIHFYIWNCVNNEEEELNDENMIKTIRYLNVVGIIALYTKASYFLSLIDEIAPLIDIIK